MSVLVVLARSVSPSSFGTFALASTIVGTTQLISGQGLLAAITQRHEMSPKYLGSAFASILVASFILGGGLFFSAPLLARLLTMPALSPLLHLLALCLPINAFCGVPIAFWRRELRFRRIAGVTTISQLIASVIAVIVAMKGGGIWSLVVRQLGEAVITLLLTLYAVPWRSLFRASFSAYRELLLFGLPVLGSNLMAMARNRLDEVLIGAWLGAEQLGYYAMARRQLDGIASLVPAVIGNGLMPVLARNQRDPRHVRTVLLHGLALLGLGTFPVFAVIGASASVWVPFFLGSRWLPAIPLVEALAVIVVAFAITSFILNALIAIGHPARRFIVEAVISSLALLVLLVALPFGIHVVAWSSALAMLLLAPLAMLWASRWLPLSLRQQLAPLQLPAVAAVLLVAVTWVLQACFGRVLSPLALLVLMVLPAAAVLYRCYRLLPPFIEPSALSEEFVVVEEHGTEI